MFVLVLKCFAFSGEVLKLEKLFLHQWARSTLRLVTRQSDLKWMDRSAYWRESNKLHCFNNSLFDVYLVLRNISASSAFVVVINFQTFEILEFSLKRHRLADMKSYNFSSRPYHFFFLNLINLCRIGLPTFWKHNFNSNFYLVKLEIIMQSDFAFAVVLIGYYFLNPSTIYLLSPIETCPATK